MIERSYSFVTLQYVHDLVTGEFVNVGSLMFAPAQDGLPAEVRGRTSHKISRHREMFPDLDRSEYLAAIRRVDDRIGAARTRFGSKDLFSSDLSLKQVCSSILPDDDSSLRWSSMSSGVTTDVDKTFERIFQRHVARYEAQDARRRPDDEVWRPVKDMLRERAIGIELEAKVIAGRDDKIEFSHAWKNGIWHVYEPLSLDLADEKGIMEKARRWLGNLTSVCDAVEEFMPHFIMGRPLDPALLGAYDNALKVLSKAPMRVEVFDESDAMLLVDKIEREWHQHQENYE